MGETLMQPRTVRNYTKPTSNTKHHRALVVVRKPRSNDDDKVDHARSTSSTVPREIRLSTAWPGSLHREAHTCFFDPGNEGPPSPSIKVVGEGSTATSQQVEVKASTCFGRKRKTQRYIRTIGYKKLAIIRSRRVLDQRIRVPTRDDPSQQHRSLCTAHAQAGYHTKRLSEVEYCNPSKSIRFRQNATDGPPSQEFPIRLSAPEY